MKKFFFTLMLLAVTFVSPAQKKKSASPKKKQTEVKPVLPDGKIENGVYTCNLFPWQIAIPNGYTIRTEELMNEQTKGSLAIAKHIMPDYDLTIVVTPLICFESSLHTYFLANYQLIYTSQMPLKEQQPTVAKFMQDAHNFQGAQTTVTNSQLKLGRHDFIKIAFEMYHPQLKLTKYQEVYMAYIGDYLFSASINFMDEYDGKILRNNFFQSMELKN